MRFKWRSKCAQLGHETKNILGKDVWRKLSISEELTDKMFVSEQCTGLHSRTAQILHSGILSSWCKQAKLHSKTLYKPQHSESLIPIFLHRVGQTPLEGLTRHAGLQVAAGKGTFYKLYTMILPISNMLVFLY